MSTAAAGPPTTRPNPLRNLFIQSLSPRSGAALDATGINVLVGPNNSGKSELLRDLLRLMTGRDPESPATGDGRPAEPRQDESSRDEPRVTVLNDLQFVPKLTLERCTFGLTAMSTPDGDVWQGIGPELRTGARCVLSADIKNVLFRPIITARATWTSPLNALLPLRVAYLNADRRREAVQPVSPLSPLRPPESLLQALQDAPVEIHQELADAFAEVFGDVRLLLDDADRVQLCLRIDESSAHVGGGRSRSGTPGTSPAAAADSSAAELAPSPAELARQLAALRRLDQQGDAFQSVAAVQLAMLVGQGRVLLLDDADAHLYPEQARRFGEWLGRRAAALGCQVFLAAHDFHLLNGLIESNAEVTIWRVTRRGDATRLRTVGPELARKLARHPLCAAHQMLGLLTLDGAVVTASEDERLLFETVGRRTVGVAGLRFLHTFGARNLAPVCTLLRQAGIPTCVISDLEMMRSETRFDDLVRGVTGEPAPAPWQATRSRLAKHVVQERATGGAWRPPHEVESFLATMKSGAVEPPSLADVADVADDQAWQRFRGERLDRLPPEVRGWVEELLEDLKRKGVFVAPHGRLEGWLELPAGDDRQAWLNQAVQQVLAGKCPAELRAFVGEAIQQLRAALVVPQVARLGNGA